MSPETAAYVALIKSCGYRVFMRKLDDEYCFYTDGIRIGYAQWSDIRNHVSSVHKPNSTNGTGFHVAYQIEPDTLKDALYCHRPSWAMGNGTVDKYRDWDAYHQANDFNRQLFEV